MQYARCWCGNMQSWSSGMPLAACARCEKCGGGYGYSPSTHIEPVDHDFVAHPAEIDGGQATLSRCRHCHYTRKQIEKMEAARGERSNRP